MVGAVHIAQALVPFAAQRGFAVTVVDPRRSFASDERFPNVAISTEWPDEAMDALRPDTPHRGRDADARPEAGRPGARPRAEVAGFYIGALGSRRTHAARLGAPARTRPWRGGAARIRGPVGLDIEAVTAPEIALSIMAEIVAVRRGAPSAATGTSRAA